MGLLYPAGAGRHRPRQTHSLPLVPPRAQGLRRRLPGWRLPRPDDAAQGFLATAARLADRPARRRGRRPRRALPDGPIGEKRQYPAQLEALHQHGDGILEVVCRPHDDWPGQRAGQFLLANFGAKAEGAHPFTIASACQRQTGTLTFAIKALGDFTGKLAQTLRVGQTIQIECPYGNFNCCPSGAVDRNRGLTAQIWVAGGIGVTPFLARLKDRIARPSAASETDFFYCTPQATAYPKNLEALCQQAGVRLHRRLTDQQGPLDPADIEARLKPGASVWFCGPAAWGEALGRTLTGNGLPREAFHREAFEFR